MRGWCVAGFLCVLSMAGCDSSQQAERPVTSLTVASVCDIQRGCEVADAALSILVRFATPPRALKPFSIELRAAGKERIETVMLTFLMKGMDMGLNRYRMLGDARSGWRAEVILPICVSGRSDWLAEFELVTSSRRILLRVPFVLQK
jgi:hypothetical protein